MEFSTEKGKAVEKYAMPYRISSFEIDPTRRLRLSMLLKLVQEVAGRHFDEMGLTYEVMKRQGMVYLVTREAIKINRLPAYSENLSIETWFRENKGAQYIREACILCGDEIAVEIDTAWVLADAVSHRILRPSAFPYEVPRFNQNVGVEVQKIALPQGMQNAGSREIRRSDIDCNGHMNNAVYADIVLDFLPEELSEKEISEFRISFINEALLGESLTIQRAESGDSLYFCGLCGERRCFEAELRLK